MENNKNILHKPEEEEKKDRNFYYMLMESSDFIDRIDKEYGLDFLKHIARDILIRVRHHTSEEEFEKIINNLKNNSNIMAEKHKGELKND